MRLAENSSEIIESFFREYLNDEDFELPKINFFAGKLASVISTFLRIQGITIGKSILISPNSIILENNKKTTSKTLIVHEIAHVLQYRREGFFRFLYKYFRSYLGNFRKKRDWSPISRLEAYLEIPFEIEARKVADDFVKWQKHSDYWCSKVSK